MKYVIDTDQMTIVPADAAATPAAPPLPFSEGALDPSLLAIQSWKGPGFDYANRPTEGMTFRAPAIPSQLDEIGKYTINNWATQTPPVSFMDYLLMLHDLIPSLTEKQRFQIRAGRWSAANMAVAHNGGTQDMPYLELADRWLFPEKYQTEEDKAAAARAQAEWDAHWAAKEANKSKPREPSTTQPPVDKDPPPAGGDDTPVPIE